MSEAFCAAIDWGTTSFRLWLLAADGKVLAERRSDDGLLTTARGDFAAIMEKHLAATAAGPDLPVVICGMAGSRQGWHEVRYLDVPAKLAEITSHAGAVPGQARDVRILPGIAQRDERRPDVMRGEETQLLGALGAKGGRVLVCMPGTHSKWVALDNGAIDAISTFMTGELFRTIGRNTILAHAIEERDGIAAAPAFAEAVRRAVADDASLLNDLFAIRSSQLLGFRERADGAPMLSGALIGAEIAGARRLLGAAGQVTLVASNPLAALYRRALAVAEMEVNMVDADAAVRGGLLLAARRIWSDGSVAAGVR